MDVWRQRHKLLEHERQRARDDALAAERVQCARRRARLSLVIDAARDVQRAEVALFDALSADAPDVRLDELRREVCEAIWRAERLQSRRWPDEPGDMLALRIGADA